MNYSQFVSRNWGFVSAEEQERLRSSSVALAGCGMGSAIAEVLVRTGFEQLSLADGDVVECSNLNRQLFTRGDVGLNKAAATASRLRSINPSVCINACCDFIQGEQSIREFLAGSKVLVNMVDINANFLEVNRIAREMHIPSIFPINLGWGGSVLVFLPHTDPLEKIFNLISPERIIDAFVDLAMTSKPRDYMREVIAMFHDRKNSSWPSEPQLAAAVYLNAGLVSTIVTQLLLGHQVVAAPNAISIDMYELVRANGD